MSTLNLYVSFSPDNFIHVREITSGTDIGFVYISKKFKFEEYIKNQEGNYIGIGRGHRNSDGTVYVRRLDSLT